MGGVFVLGVNGWIGSLVRWLFSKKIWDFVKGLMGGMEKNFDEVIMEDEGVISVVDGIRVEVIELKSEKGVRRVLYIVNVGDVRVVFW